MAEPPQQKCNAYQEDLLKKRDPDDFCPLCNKLGVEVEIGFHKSREARTGQLAQHGAHRTAAAAWMPDDTVIHIVAWLPSSAARVLPFCATLSSVCMAQMMLLG